MSYASENFLPAGTRLDDVREFVDLFGYVKSVSAINRFLRSNKSDPSDLREFGRIEEYSFFDQTDYRSWSGVELSIQIKDKKLTVYTRTTMARSYYDLTHQNRTISSLKRRFGGTFETDEGRGRYLRPGFGPPPPPASGAHLAFERFGGNLIRAGVYLDSRTFPVQQGEALFAAMGMSPRVLSNNLLIPFLVASLEDFFRSTFVALLRYSPRKLAFFKNVRLTGEHLASVSDQTSTVDEAVAQMITFQNLSLVCTHFEALEPRLNMALSLRKPYRRRKQSLYQMIEALVRTRHEFVHRAKLDVSLTDAKMKDVIYDLDAALSRVHQHLVDFYRWPAIERGWFLGNRKARDRAVAAPPATSQAPPTTS